MTTTCMTFQQSTPTITPPFSVERDNRAERGRWSAEGDLAASRAEFW